MRLSIAVIALAAAIGCAATDITAPPIAGVYRLEMVNGATPPAMTTGILSAPALVIGGTITLSADNSFVGELDLRQIVDGVSYDQTLSQAGTYSRAGDQLTFSDSNGIGATAWLREGSITITVDEISLVFVRQ